MGQRTDEEKYSWKTAPVPEKTQTTFSFIGASAVLPAVITVGPKFPYTGSHRQFGIDGISGIYELTVPASAVQADHASVIEVEILPFERWQHGWFMVKEYRDVLKPPGSNTSQRFY